MSCLHFNPSNGCYFLIWWALQLLVRHTDLDMYLSACCRWSIWIEVEHLESGLSFSFSKNYKLFLCCFHILAGILAWGGTTHIRVAVWEWKQTDSSWIVSPISLQTWYLLCHLICIICPSILHPNSLPQLLFFSFKSLMHLPTEIERLPWHVCTSM